MALRRAALAIGARLLERQLNADEGDYAGPLLPCPDCRGPARYAGRPDKTFLTALGEVTLRRAYYHCPVCETGFFPRDRALGLDDGSLSPAVARMVGRTAAGASFQESSDLLWELAGLRVDPKQVERTAEALGAAISLDERETVEPAGAGELAPTMYTGVDGTGIPMRRAALEGRAGKQPDGSAKTREVKLCVVWTAESRDKDGWPVRDEGSASYNAAIESAASSEPDEPPAAFIERVRREAVRRGFDRAARQVILGDGAKWIWNMATEHFPDAIQIVDRFHAKERIIEAAKAVYGARNDLQEQWTKARWDELDGGKLDDLIAAFNPHVSTHDEARKCQAYLQRNRPRLDYPKFEAAGLVTATGIIESGCKTVIGQRLKQSGMHWTVEGADAIIALRCCLLSGRYEDFWERRREKRAANLNQSKI